VSPQGAVGAELVDLAARVAGWARPGEQIEVYALRSKDTDIDVYEGRIESLSSAESAGMGVRVVRAGRQGFAYAGSLEEDLLAETLTEARDNAGFASVDPWAGLAVPDGVAPVGLELWREDLASMPTSDKVERALGLEAAVRAADSRVSAVPSASWGDSSVEMALASSEGILASTRRTVCYLSAVAAASDGRETQTGAGYSVGRSPAEVDLDRAASDAARRATRLLGATKPASARLTVVLEPRITASLLAILAGTLDGESVAKGRSLFADRLGEQVGAPGLSLVDDPTDPEAYGAAAVDAEGLATRRNVLIEGGVLERFLYDSYAARRAGTSSTASAVRAGFKSPPRAGARALSVVPGSATPEEIYSSVGDGLLVQAVSGLHSGVNPVSGDFSVGADGVMIRGGELAGPVREVTVASTLQRMLQAVVAVGGDLERVPGPAAGVTLAIAEVSMSGR